MKVTVKENKVDEIDFSVVGQYLISTEKRIVITSGEHKKHDFSATALNEDLHSNYRQGDYHDRWQKSFFKKFNGTITIEQ